MRRGFKSQSEKISSEVRDQIGLTTLDRLDTKLFLDALGIIVWTPNDVPGLDQCDIDQLTNNDPDSWSGVTIRENEKIAIIINPSHPDTRQANTLMHEWAHLRLRHKPNRVDRSEHGLLLLTDYPAELEEEADWLAGAVLLPRDGLLYHRQHGLSTEAIANHYRVSESLATWRLRMTGVDRQTSSRFHRL